MKYTSFEVPVRSGFILWYPLISYVMLTKYLSLKFQSPHMRIGIIIPAWEDTPSDFGTSHVSFLFISIALIWFGTTVCLALKEKMVQCNFQGLLMGYFRTIRYKQIWAEDYLVELPGKTMFFWLKKELTQLEWIFCSLLNTLLQYRRSDMIPEVQYWWVTMTMRAIHRGRAWR